MNLYIGIDLGTSGMKMLLVDTSGKILNEHTETYDVSYPHSGWSEQNPLDWYRAMKVGIKCLLKDQDNLLIKGIAIAGQMHGLVTLDKDDKVIRPAILWNDGRSVEETRYLNEVIGKNVLSQRTANIAFAGFTLPKLLWMKNNELDNFNKISKIMLPKDYLVYRLSGEFATDVSDASGTLYFDVKNRSWSKEMLDLVGISEDKLPKVYESYEKVGTITKELADELGLNKDVIIAAGAGDNAGAAIGTGTTQEGSCNISLGTSGTIFISSNHFSVDPNNALHSFCHANGKYHLMACILSAASCNSWWMDNVLETKEYNKEQEGLENHLGKNEVFFLPYLLGERSPHNDVNARSAFIGMRPDTSRKDMTLSVLEGVAFALRDCIEVARSNGINITKTRICGGGAKSKLWCKIIANVLGMEVEKLEVNEGPSFGAAILAMMGNHEFESFEEATNKLVKGAEVTYPSEELVLLYDKRYQTFKKIYPALKQVFRN